MWKKVIGVSAVIGAAVCEAAAVVKLIQKNYLAVQMERADRNDANCQLAYQWIHMCQKGNRLGEYLKSRNIQTAAIYGMGDMGKILYEELKRLGIQAAYGIDKNKNVSQIDGLPVKSLSDTLPQADIIIVTPVYFYAGIKKELKTLTDIQIVSLEEIIGQALFYGSGEM